MARFLWGLLAVLLFAAFDGTQAADQAQPAADGKIPTGIWKVTIWLGPGQDIPAWLVQLQVKDGKASGEATALNSQKPTVRDVHVKDGQLFINFRAGNNSLPFEGKLPAEGGKKILGTIRVNQLTPAALELTGLKTLDAYDYYKEVVAQNTAGPELFDAALKLIGGAVKQKAKPEEVRSWAAKAAKAAAAYGSGWQLEIDVRLVEAMAEQDNLAPVALLYARQAERLLTPATSPVEQRRVLGVLAQALKKAGKDDEAKEIETRIEKLPRIALRKFTGRKVKNDRVVLVELFTGAECPPCVAADLAFDALGKTFKPTEAVLLQYHLHVPRPDPLTNADTEARAKFYDEEVGGTPAILFNGKAGPEGGGPAERAQNLYDAYADIVDSLLEKDPKAQIKLTALQKGTKISIAAEISDVDKPSDSTRLRFALVEDAVKYQGGNKLAEHHHVVRAMPGGAGGFVVKAKTLKQSVSVDLDQLRKQLTKYLEEFEKERKFPNKERPLALKKFKVVAFIQNDSTKEVYQAAQADIQEEGK